MRHLEKYYIWMENKKGDITPINCKFCEYNEFEILNGDRLPWELKIQCTKCNRNQIAKGRLLDEWIKFLDI